MMNVVVAPIVEGHGEVEAARTLLTRTVEALGLDCSLHVLQPIRVSRSKVVNDPHELRRPVELAVLKLATTPADRKFVLLLLDADQDLACKLAPVLVAAALQHRSDIDISCVLPVSEYESWLVAGADTLTPFLVDGFEEHIPDDPEATGAGKGWIQRFFAAPKYSETADQARLSAAFAVEKARERSRSFDKLCRELILRCS
jgi:Domain of unknown function (DUF4276)